MRDIKTKEIVREPRVRSAASKKPKELIRAAALESKEKGSRVSESRSGKGDQESPVEYAGDKVQSAEEWAGRKAGNTAGKGGRSLAKKSAQKIQERKQERKTAEEVREAVRAKEGQEASVHPGGSDGESRVSQSRMKKAQVGKRQEVQSRKIKTKPNPVKAIHNSPGKSIKSAPRVVKSSQISKDAGKIAVAQKKQATQTARAAKQMAVRSAQTVQRTAEAAKKTAKVIIKGISTAVKGTVSAVKSVGAWIAAGGSAAVILIIMVGVIGGIMFATSSQSSESLSEEVLAHTPTIQKYADEYGIPEYTAVIQAIMMQESGGKGDDPMQSSECPYNKKYPNTPNGITDPEYSIQVGVQYYADCVKGAGCEGPYDMDRLKLSLQGYNYGNGYISWAIKNHGGYSEANALQFSQEKAAQLEWQRYGDPEYVSHVLRYYSSGNIFAGLFGNEQIVSVALAEVGSEGGNKFWSWYGFSSRQEWCACFVSWCANQCGLIDAGAVPKFSYCPTGVSWFKSNGKWQDKGYIPSAGTIIFFDRNSDGISDHVGIVEYCENGMVYTVEGNSGDAVKQRSYSVDNKTIMGYGVVSF